MDLKRVLLLLISMYTVWTFGSFAAYVVGLDPIIGPMAAAISAVGLVLGPTIASARVPR